MKANRQWVSLWIASHSKNPVISLVPTGCYTHLHALNQCSPKPKSLHSRHLLSSGGCLLACGLVDSNF